MTEQPTAQQVVPIAATSTPRLAQLHAAYDEAQAAYDAAASHFEAIKTGIKAELAALAPEGSTRIGLTGEHGPGLSLTYAESWRLDSRKMKREDPETYVRYAKPSGSWTLRATKAGDSE